MSNLETLEKVTLTPAVCGECKRGVLVARGPHTTTVLDPGIPIKLVAELEDAYVVVDTGNHQAYALHSAVCLTAKKLLTIIEKGRDR